MNREATIMITIDEILALPESYPVEVTSHFPAEASVQPPKPKSMMVWFKDQSPVAWQLLMTNLTEVDVSVYGTRQSTGSGATDDTLYPAYAALLPSVNARRAEIGLAPVRN